MVRAPTEETANLIPPEKNPQFFKIYLPDHSSQKLKIPPGFINLLNGVVPNKAILRSRDARVWHVELEQVEGSFFFQNGWQGFVKDQSLQLGEFLVFRYNGDSVFDVKIFGKSGCEKVEPLAYKNCDQAASDIEKEEQPETEEIIKKNTRLRRKKKKRSAKYGSTRAEKETEMALKAAGLPRPKNPHFVSSFKPGRPFELFIPGRMIHKHHVKIGPEMTVCDPSGRHWCVKISKWKDGRLSFARGWSVLCKENNLIIDDRCIFEFTKGRDGKCGIIQMHIVRAGAGTSMPDTCG
ncbi:hypothetical protein NE237_017920 [Protea cynaroides]|uniref:TF-B3 domain-containing protein n=1 Tax=Protea cynaroides TaxID=273540 RepID=A0A9Q0K8X6_9MAGN|nr:hypothetical protein NE237_017920 [Protea cynaroides]